MKWTKAPEAERMCRETRKSKIHVLLHQISQHHDDNAEQQRVVAQYNTAHAWYVRITISRVDGWMGARRKLYESCREDMLCAHVFPSNKLLFIRCAVVRLCLCVL